MLLLERGDDGPVAIKEGGSLLDRHDHMGNLHGLGLRLVPWLVEMGKEGGDSQQPIFLLGKEQVSTKPTESQIVHINILPS